MAKGMGVGPRHLAPVEDYWGGVQGVVTKQTVAGTSSYQLFPGGATYPLRVTRVRGIMTGAGASSDTVVVNNHAGSAICNTIDVSALSDTDSFEEAQINDANWDIERGQNLTLVTASGALAYVIVEFMRRAP